MKKYLLSSLAIGLLAASAASASAATVQLGSYTGSSGTHSAKATFSTDGTSLFVQLENTGSVSDFNSIADLLTGIVFDLNGVTLKSTGGSATAASLVNASGGNPNTLSAVAGSTNANVSAEWGGGSLTGGFQGFTTGDIWISSAGLGIPGGGQSFTGGNLQGGSYSVIPSGTTTSANGNGLSNQNPFVSESVTITFAIDSGTFTSNSFGNAKFLFGTQPETVTGDVPFVPVTGATPPTPLPAAAWSGSLAIMGLGAWRKMRRKA